MKYLLVLMLVLVSGCGVTVHSDPIKVDPVTMNHNVTINSIQLAQFYEAYCESQYGSQSEIDDCVTAQLANFWLAIQNSTQNGQVNQTGGH